MDTLQEINFKNIEKQVQEGLTGSYAFLRDSLSTDYYEDAQGLHNDMMVAVSKWLQFVRGKMKDGKPVVEDGPGNAEDAEEEPVLVPIEVTKNV